ncbi:flavin reductase family protein [Streptomyces axinellae]|jgi:flavin reductase (DIM6/NTAB) family NADH-FMN oxidoreductase RutF|uniref:Flavin reductase like domain-containing protein n=1 Tax=Streptomyces axinellae TaxID=552788 RepID=A0ABP6CJ58_9ACTN
MSTHTATPAEETHTGAAPAAPEVPEDQVKGLHRKFVTGVTIVTTMDGDRPRGLAVNAFSSISLSPPLVMVCVQRTSSTYEPLFRSRHMGISILASDQLPVASVFATKSSDKFAELRWTPAAHGSPLIDHSAATLEARIEERLQTTTHTIFVGRVVQAAHSDRPPLIYSAGGFYDGGRLDQAAS